MRSLHSAVRSATAVVVALFLLCCLLGRVQGRFHVHLVPHTHNDVGWLKTVDQYYMGSNKTYDRHAAVQYILNSVIPALQANPARKFIYVEQGFFQRWWRQQTGSTQTAVRQLLSSGQLEFINGGWCMHDEGATHYIDMIDQTTLGHRYIKQMFNATPSIGWQIDPFGHSLTQASLLSYAAGFDAVFLGRIDYADHALLYNQSRLEFIWRGNPTAGSGPGTRDQVFTQATPTGGYNAPRGLCWDQTCDDPGVQDDPSLTDYNLPERVQAFVDAAVEQGTHSNCPADTNATCNIMWMMGEDFQSVLAHCCSEAYENANVWFKNMDKIIRGVNADGRVSTDYSTPSLYIAAKNAESVTWTTVTTDFFPYGSAPHSYWTGYLSSRPALKRMVRTSSAFLQMARQLEFWSQQPAAETMSTGLLEEAVAVSQHHDAVAGTSRQHVAYDYAQRLGRGLDAADAMVNTALATLVGGAAELSFSSCPLLNVSVCGTQESLPRVLLLYNPLARVRRELVHVPLNVSASSLLTVVNSGNTSLPYQLVSAFVTSAAVTGAAPSTLSFYADVPGLGYETFIISQHATEAGEEEVGKPAQATTVSATAASAVAAVLSSRRWSVVFDSQGLLASVTDLLSNVTRPLSQQFFFYTNGSRDGQQAGAYILLPDSATPSPVSSAPVNLTLLPELLVPEARQQVSSWLYQTLRLRDDSIEFEWTVGEIPYADSVGREVITRYSSGIQSAARWWSDNNGREFSLRQRDYRSTWPYQVTEPVAGNYVPSNLGCGLNDSSAAMFVLVDRAQGCVSMADGQLEFLLHRRLYLDDGKGLYEPLNETESIIPGRVTQRVGKGLVVTGKHWLVLEAAPVQTATDVVRTLASRVYSPLHLVSSPLNASVSASSWLSSHAASASLLAFALPPNVELVTLQTLPSPATGALLRLSHLFGRNGVDDSAALSMPVTVNVSALLNMQVTAVEEVSLTANQRPVAQRPAYNWRVAGESAADVARGRRAQQAQTLRPEDDGVITIFPMEVRTFMVNFAPSAQQQSATGSLPRAATAAE